MDTAIRITAIIIEVSLLAAIGYAILGGVYLAVFDLGVKTKYQKIIAMALVTVGIVAVVFFIAHLTTFYPPALD
jgi:multisubunit Na+/H+ antiporter MnhC subunit